MNALIAELRHAGLVVGFTSQRFDYTVLQGHNDFFDPEQVPTMDMMVDLQNKLQHRLSLDSIANATFGVEKTSEGLQAIRWFREGKMMEIAEYCCYDVKLTKMVHEFGMQHGQIFFTNKFGKTIGVPVDW